MHKKHLKLTPSFCFAAEHRDFCLHAGKNAKSVRQKKPTVGFFA